MFDTFALNTSFGDFDIYIDEDDKTKQEENAVQELIENLNAANCKQAYYNSDNKIYAVEIGFYYGSQYVELECLQDDENEATIQAANKLIQDLENEF